MHCLGLAVKAKEHQSARVAPERTPGAQLVVSAFDAAQRGAGTAHAHEW